MRVMLVVLLSCSSLSYGQHQGSFASCSQQAHGSLTDAYYHAVLERALQPPNWQITISISIAGSESKLVLREQSGKFELLRGFSQNDIHSLLSKLEASCELPADPIEMANRVKITWASKQIPATQFDQLHREFTSALSLYASDVQTQYAVLMATHTAFLNLHVAQYLIVYDNKSKHIEIRADNTESHNPQTDSITLWTHSILKLGEESF